MQLLTANTLAKSIQVDGLSLAEIYALAKSIGLEEYEIQSLEVCDRDVRYLKVDWLGFLPFQQKSGYRTIGVCARKNPASDLDFVSHEVYLFNERNKITIDFGKGIYGSQKTAIAAMFNRANQGEWKIAIGSSKSDKQYYTVEYVLEPSFCLSKNYSTEEALEILQDIEYQLDCSDTDITQEEFIVNEYSISIEDNYLFFEVNGSMEIFASSDEEAEELATQALDNLEWVCAISAEEEDYSQYRIESVA